MKTLIWDVECTDIETLVRSYGLRLNIKYLNHKQIQRDWTLLGAAWMDLDDDKPKVISVSPDRPLDDYAVTVKLHEVLSEARVVIGHNVDKFDMKKFNTRAIFYDLPPIPPPLSIDTLKMARKYFAFTSNSLAYLCDFLDVGFKDESPDWAKIIDGCPKELRYMRKYNKQDVIATKAVYLKLRSYHHTHPNMNVPVVREEGTGAPIDVCKHCQSPELKKVQVRYLRSGRARRQYQCKVCHGFTTTDLIK